MKTVELMLEALGPPQALQQFGSGSVSIAAVGRWRHGSASVDLRNADTFQVVFNVSGGHDVELACGQHVIRKSIRAGSIGIVSPDDITSVAIKGAADIIQFFLSRDLIEAVSGGRAPTKLSQLAVPQSKLQAAAAQALLALEWRGPDQRGVLEAIVVNVARLFGPAIHLTTFKKGGLNPTARRHVQALTDAALAEEVRSQPSVSDLARAAGLSVFHFVRSFRQTEGQSPLAHVTTSRIDASLALMLKADARVDEVAYKMGFSSPSHFISAFRKHLGVTPGALRDVAHGRR